MHVEKKQALSYEDMEAEREEVSVLFTMYDNWMVGIDNYNRC